MEQNAGSRSDGAMMASMRGKPKRRSKGSVESESWWWITACWDMIQPSGDLRQTARDLPMNLSSSMVHLCLHRMALQNLPPLTSSQGGLSLSIGVLPGRGEQLF
jgi:hypothetical protein